MKKPTIGFIIPRLGITDRGAEVFVYELTRRLSADFEIIIWVRKSSKESELIRDLVKNDIKIKKVSCVSEQDWLVHFLNTVPSLKTVLDMFHLNPTEIEMFTFSLACMPGLFFSDLDILFPVSGVWGVFLCRLVRAIKKIPLVYTSVGGIEPLIARQKPDLHISINPGIARWIKSHFPNLKVEYIPTGVDLARFHQDGNKAHVDLRHPIFITVAALIPSKRVDLTIKAVGKLKRGSLLIVGDGPQKEKLFQLAQKCLGKGRFLFQSVTYHELPAFYRAADVFAFSAPAELGWGMVHLEALACGLPIVANKEENLEFLTKRKGFLCDVTNIDTYSACLEKAAKFSPSESFRKLVQNYSWENVSGKYKKNLLDIIYAYKKN